MDFQGDIFIPCNEPTHALDNDMAVVYVASYMVVSYMQRQSEKDKSDLVAFIRSIHGKQRDFILMNMATIFPASAPAQETKQDHIAQSSAGGHRRMSLSGTSISDLFFEHVAHPPLHV